MSDQPILSPLAEVLLRLHRADDQPGRGGKPDYKQVKGYTDDEVADAYRELEQAGLLERAGGGGSVGDTPPHYQVSQKEKEGSA